ncbi:MAG: capsular biosynthesis protein [Leptolyngbya foveolarum]|uniref:Capsular biosynthesis protein n=1 Tax=Leptolyngbya foveolarum TaxID=47253 RepID=A0A2W4UPG1_9CYAN|nr:MAG: capsular biosynthesis protein [Leptolyngbya foveolarum]
MKSEVALPLPPSPVMTTQPPAEELEGGLNVGQLLRTLRRKWWVILGIALATTAAAGAKVITDKPTYVSNLEILVRPLSAETEVISSIPETLTGATPAASGSPLDQDLLAILISPSLLEPVVADMRTRYPEICSGTGADGALIEATTEQCYRIIRQSLQVDALGKDSDIIQVIASSPEPDRALALLNAVSDAYLAYSLSSKQSDIRRGVKFVDQKLPDLRKKVDTLQGQLQKIRLDNNIIDPDSRGSDLASQVSAFSKEQKELQVELEQLRNVYQNLQQSEPGEGNASSALSQNPRYQTLLNSLLELDAQIAEASTLYLDSSPDMQVLREQRQNLQSLLSQQGSQSEQEIASQIRELEARERAIQDTIQNLNAGIDDLSGISRNYTDIQRELTVATENLTQFLAKREALEIDSAQREIPWEVVTPPTEPRPQLASLPQNLLLGGILGTLMGIGVALLLDKSGGVIYSDEEIRRLTRLPVLGRIPRQDFSEMELAQESMAESLQYVGATIRSEQNGRDSAPSFNGVEHTSLAYGNNPFSEAFRSLYTNLRLINATHPTRSVAVGSVMPGEGKSTVALHLAQAAAAMGQRVLLVDADLRNPQIHKYLGISNEKGLTNLFSGESNPALIQKFLPEPNLYVIAAGSAPFDPARLFSSRSMKRFTEKVRKTFDLVIYDTPPLLGQSDAYIVANHADGLLLVTQPGKIKQSLLDRAMEQLQIADINVLGLVTRE